MIAYASKLAADQKHPQSRGVEPHAKSQANFRSRLPTNDNIHIKTYQAEKT